MFSDADDSTSITSVTSMKSQVSLPERQVYRKIQLRFLTEEEKQKHYALEDEKQPLLGSSRDGYSSKAFVFKVFPCCSCVD